MLLCVNDYKNMGCLPDVSFIYNTYKCVKSKESLGVCYLCDQTDLAKVRISSILVELLKMSEVTFSSSKKRGGMHARGFATCFLTCLIYCGTSVI